MTLYKMTPYKRTEITIETDEVLVIRRRRGAMRAWCRKCGCEVDIVDLAEAAALSRTTGPALRDYAEARGCHVLKGEDGQDLMCMESWLNVELK